MTGADAWQDRTLIFLDLETTGLDVFRDRIIECAAIRTTGRAVLAEMDTLVNPGIPIPDFVTRLTGIGQAEITAQGRPLSDVLPELREFVGDFPIIGHNIGFDLSFLEAAGLKLPNRTLDSLLLTALVLPTEKSYGLSSLVRKFFQETEQHRALSDTRHVFKLFWLLVDSLGRMDRRLLDKMADLLGEEQSLIVELLRAAGSQAMPPDLPAASPEPAADPNAPGGPGVLGEPPEDEQMELLLGPDGILSRLGNYEYRPQQLEMAREVARVFQTGGTTVIEAPTGIGKSFAYLIPAVLFAATGRKRVVVSTNTKNLQTQIWEKELPFLADNLPGIKWKASRLLGRDNYFCLRRFRKLQESGRSLFPGSRFLLAYFTSFGAQSREGILTESAQFLGRQYPEFYQRLDDLRAAGEGCPAGHCPWQRQCFYQKAFRNAADADLIISNHALTLSPPGVFPEFEYLILDEAHNVEDVATETYSRGVESAEINKILSSAAVGDSEIAVAWQKVFSGLLRFLPEKGTRNLEDLKQDSLWPDTELNLDNFLLLWQELENTTYRKTIGRKDEEAEELLARVQAVKDDFRFIFSPQDNYLGFAGRYGTRGDWYLKSAPVQVDRLLTENLFQYLKGAVLTSATLTVSGSFDFFLTRWGLAGRPDVRTAVLDSPFDVPGSVVLAIPRNFPRFNYRDGDSRFVSALSRGISSSALALRGKSLVLFASRQRMEGVYRRIKDSLGEAGITVFCQNLDGSRSALAERLKSWPGDCLLLGTRSFQEGVDISGLSAVMIEKIPFPGQEDPLISARRRIAGQSGGNGFQNYILPLAAISLRQAFGRLIRQKTDRGLVIIFDARVIDDFPEVLDSLPECPKFIGDVPDFYRKLPGMRPGTPAKSR